MLDTLKGRVFNSCENQNPTTKKNGNTTLTMNSTICFSYMTGPYSNEIKNYKVDSSLLDSLGNLTLREGQDLIVFLDHSNYLWDLYNDYLSVTLFRVLPIIDGQVKDINNEWSNSLLLNYPDWKNYFIQNRDILLNGGY